ncbi:tyrosine-type recombinase/integrase [Bradyrhizobium sp. PMVTL-01]|uniref:tyrosine-type recombinase/integrase n=1 Tax=Bradyrhizobium sp. PMVTL-01 TaxID=3434999 RepID=UPI003F72E0C2
MWRATKAAVKAGYPVKTVNLAELAGNEIRLRQRCQRLQSEMREWLTSGTKKSKISFDGTFGTLLDIYQSDPKSTYVNLEPASKVPYDVYLRMLKPEIGRCRIDITDGVEVKTWFEFWATPATEGGEPQLAKAHMALSVVKAAVTFGIMRRLPGCTEFKEVLNSLKGQLPHLRPRKIAMTADQIIAARAGATELQHQRAAFAYALAFEGAVRVWDVVGKWVPISDKRPSTVIHLTKKWLGPTWANVDESLILRWTPAKTEHTSGETIAIDLRACPMVMEELEWIPQEARQGPLVINPETGRPYTVERWAKIWRTIKAEDAKKEHPQLPAKAWTRDLRKSGSTEARAAGARLDDVKKVMGHTPETEVTDKVYDLAKVEAHRRVAEARTAHRAKK